MKRLSASLFFIYEWLILVGILGAFVLVALCIYFGWPLNIIGWNFVLAGTGFSVPQLLAIALWQEKSGTVTNTKDDGDGGTNFEFDYEVNGRTYHGKGNRSSAGIGDAIFLLVNPERPKQHFVFSVGLLFLGLAFMCMGTSFALSEPQYVDIPHL